MYNFGLVMDQTNESKRKPRRTRGTPSYYYRNRVACAVIAAGTTIFALYTFTPFYQQFNERLKKTLEPTEQEIDRRLLFKKALPRTSSSIEKSIEESKKVKNI